MTGSLDVCSGYPQALGLTVIRKDDTTLIFHRRGDDLTVLAEQEK